MKTAKLITATFSIMVIAIHVQAQGSLTPPGAPSETMKTLEQIEPRVDVATLSSDGTRERIISEPGSYYLSGNLDVGKTHGIYINSTNVTLDLNGFQISRSSGSGGNGIYIAGEMDNVSIRNGTIDGGSPGFQYGIQCSSGPSYAESCLLEKLAVSQCTGTAILAGKFSRIIDCRVHDNTGNGINAREGSRLTGCIAHDNQGYGIFAFYSSSLEGCIAYNNQGSYGIAAYSGKEIQTEQLKRVEIVHRDNLVIL